MKVALIYPPYGRGRRSRYFPFGLAYVASALVQDGHEVRAIDMEGEDLDVDQAVRRTLSESPDVIGFGGMITRYRYVREIANRVREELPGAFLMAGNSGATTLPEMYLRACRLDAVVLGEGETTARSLVSALQNGDDWRGTSGIAYLRKSGEMALSEPRELLPDLDALPFPAWDLFPVEKYVRSVDHRQKYTRHLEVVASRGCPYGCVYCFRIYGRTIRRRSPESVVAEVEEIVRRYDIRYTGFPDDLFTSDRDFVMRTCRLLRERVPGIRWSCMGRVNTVDPEMLSVMRESGCDWISFGIESGSDEMLRRMKRGVDSTQCLEAVRMTREAGIHPDGSFMIGMFGETGDTVAETVDFCRRADMTGPILFVTPYPGTEIFGEALRRGLIPDVEKLVESMDAADRLLVNLSELPDEDLIALKEWAQGRIGLEYLLRRPFSRIPALLIRHLYLRGLGKIVEDFREAIRGSRAR
ncbi:B12-binding domain-containing radical SAM protein [Candidatus Fermentibacterales bacterium]|nr:B12-binding domain-containing radical SAM protein [Candidatus Fermentibacterales bacterium]